MTWELAWLNLQCISDLQANENYEQNPEWKFFFSGMLVFVVFSKNIILDGVVYIFSATPSKMTPTEWLATQLVDQQTPTDWKYKNVWLTYYSG